MAKMPRQRLSTNETLKNLADKFGIPYDTPLVDAVQDLPGVKVTRQDVRWATPKEPTNCGYARAICRTTGATKSAVYRHSTYLLTERDGAPCVVRYQTHEDMRVYTKHFDRTGRMAEQEVTLRAPCQSMGLAYKRKHDEDYKKRVASGEHVIKPRGAQSRAPVRGLRPRLAEDHS